MKSICATVLVVDDDQDIQEVIKDRLESLGYRVLLASNGKEATNSIRTIYGTRCIRIINSRIFTNVTYKTADSIITRDNSTCKRVINFRILIIIPYKTTDICQRNNIT